MPRLVVVSAERPDMSSPLGRARRVGHLVASLAAAAPDCEIVTLAVENGVPWVTAPGADPTGWRDRLVAEARDAGGVIATDVLIADTAFQTLDAAGIELPLVVVVDRLHSLTMREAGAQDPEPEQPGRALLADHVRRREQRALERGSVVVCFSEADDARIRSIVPGTDPLVYVCPPPVAAERQFLARDGVFAFGAFACEPGHPDTEGLTTLRDAAALLVRAGVTAAVELIGEDVDLCFRELGPFLRPRPATEWSRVLGRRAVGLSLRPFGGTTPQALMDMALRGLPFVTTPASLSGLGLDEGLLTAEGAEGVASRVLELMSEQKRWTEVRDSLVDWGAALMGRRPPAQVVSGILDALKVPTSGRQVVSVRAAAVDRPAAPPPGTLAAADLAAGPFERELLGRPALSRLESHRALISRSPEDRYLVWRAAVEQHPDRVQLQRDEAVSFQYQPKVSVLLPVYETRPDLLAAVVDSVQAQTYEHWELCAVDDGSRSPDPYHFLVDRAGEDPRIRVRRLEQNQGIAGASNAALAMAEGEFIALLDHDDLLCPDALFWVVRRLQDRPDLDFVYTDWDKVDDDGATHLAFLKPDWSPDLFLGVNYLIHLAVVRRSLMEEVGGWRSGFEGAQDYELFLRVTERTDRIAHVSKPLYRWRMTAGSTATTVEAKPHAEDAGRRALEEALERRGIDGSVEPGPVPTHFRIRYTRRGSPLVTIVIPTRDRVDLLRGCINALVAETTYPRYEIIVVDNQSEDPETLEYLAELAEGRTGVPVRVVPYPHPFNYARQMNLGVTEARGDLVLMLNNDVSGFSPGWLDALVEHGQRPEVGVVGARLRFPDGRAQHEGITLSDLGGPAANLDGGGYFTYGNHVRNCLAVTGACLMTRPGVFWGVGGFDERLRVAWNDVDFCLRVSERGWRVVYTPYAELVHPESASRGPLDPAEDRARFEDRWGPPGTLRDPFFHPGLDLLNPLMFRL